MSILLKQSILTFMDWPHSLPLYVFHCNPDFSFFFFSFFLRKWEMSKLCGGLSTTSNIHLRVNFQNFRKEAPKKSFVPPWTLSEQLATLRKAPSVLTRLPLIIRMNGRLVIKQDRCNTGRYSHLAGQSTNMFSALLYIFNKPHKMKERWKIKGRAQAVQHSSRH